MTMAETTASDSSQHLLKVQAEGFTCIISFNPRKHTRQEVSTSSFHRASWSTRRVSNVPKIRQLLKDISGSRSHVCLITKPST